ncbi:hypothetical protein LTR17_020636 [Elasticomyces elasticus]|nr:hypothetical protein LTR17_020636 [Elasticomyces elasticus]
MFRMSSRSGVPRLDPTERLLHRFYEPLVLLRILNAARGAGEVELPADTRSQTFDLRWRSFVDDLAWLSDDMHGGQSVSAVAAQSLPEGNIFWLVARSARSFEHLQRVLAELKAVPDRLTPEIVSVAEQLAKESIAFCKDKIKSYARFLSINSPYTIEQLDRYEFALVYRPTLRWKTGMLVQQMPSLGLNGLSVPAAPRKRNRPIPYSTSA